jgi:DNA-binding response OmpR family regulator
MIKLLLVEDDQSLVYMEKCGLEDIVGGYHVITASNGAEGLKAWSEERPDVIVSDIDMPVMNGFDMVKRIRETDGDTVILFTSALTSPKDVTFGYEVGVDNYVKKPIIPEELDAHVRSLLRLRGGDKSRSEVNCCKFGAFTLDEAHATLRNDETEEQRTLTLRESGILAMLAANKNDVVRREVILSKFWNTEDDYFASRSLDVFVTKLRKLVASDSNIELRTVKGVGLMLLVR